MSIYTTDDIRYTMIKENEIRNKATDMQIPINIKIRPYEPAKVINYSFAMLCFYYGYDAYKLCNYVFKEV